MNDKKRIFNIKVANFLLKHNVELLEVRVGEVNNNPEACTFLFANTEKLSAALIALKKHNEEKRLMFK